MAGNKYLLADRGRLLRAKLDRLAKKLQGSLEASEFATQEAFLFEAIKTVNSFYKGLKEPQLDLEVLQVRPDDLPDPDLYNTIWEHLLNDLVTIFTELENLETLTLANFNLVTTEANRLTARLKSVSSKLGDYILYSLNPTRDALFFKDSFNDQSKIDINSPLLNRPQCDIDQAQGIITLPIDTNQDSTVRIKQLPILNPNSNGTIGNNQEIGASFNGDLNVLLDNNPDTWFEYENVVAPLTDTKEPLILDLTMNLGNEVVINHIRVNPNNFGTKTVIQIDTIETSLDGQVYTSIKDDIPIADFVQEDEAEVFNLAPSTSKYAGQGLYTFTPRKVKYIHLVFKQTEPYIISTAAGERLRYAIGIRDIDVKAYAYLNGGEIISVPFETTDEIRKVAIDSNQNPTQLSELVSIQYFVSPDDGASYYELQPKQLTGTSGILSTPETLEFNGPSTSTINTAVPVKSLRLKTVLLRNDDNFTEGASSLFKTITTKAEIHGVPQEAPFQIELDESPVDGTVIVVDPLFGSRGIKQAPYVINKAEQQINLQLYRLPFNTWPRPIKKTLVGNKYYTEPLDAADWIHVEVGGEEWTHINQAFSGYGATAKVYQLDLDKGELRFGNNTNGKTPDGSQPIQVYMDAERLFPSETEDSHLALLDFSTSSNKDDFTILRYNDTATETELLPKKATVLRLKHSNITNLGTIPTIFGGGNQQTFINGKEELTGAGHWSINQEKGIIYLKDPTSDINDTVVTYTHQPIYTLTTDDWDWATTDILRDSVAIKESAWQTRNITEYALVNPGDSFTGVTVLDLPNLSIVKGSLTFQLTGSVTDTGNGTAIDDNPDKNPLLQEIDFIDGKTELGNDVIKTIQSVPALLSTPISTFTVTKTILDNANYPVTFSNTSIFANDVSPAAPASAGEYRITKSTGLVEVYIDTTVYKSNETGSINYFSLSPTFSTNGFYSVDYKTGRIYMQRPIDPDNQDDWSLLASYEFTDFRAEYRIARFLSGNSYEVDITNNIIEFNDSEILKHAQIPRQIDTIRQPYYVVNYDYVSETREDVESLTTYFSPVVKDYALKVVTKGQIF